MNDAVNHARLIELERADAARRAVEHIIQRLEDWGTNEGYGKAARAAVKLIRGKWIYEVSEKETDIVRGADVNTNHGAQDAPRV